MQAAIEVAKMPGQAMKEAADPTDNERTVPTANMSQGTPFYSNTN